MGHKIFVDTDVIIDLFTDREPFTTSASTLFELSEQGRVSIYVSAVSINNIYYIVKRYLDNKKALRVVEDLMQITEVVGTTKAEIQQALLNDFKDFEDSIQYSTALTVESIGAIVTRNVKDYSKSKIAIFTAEDFVKSILKS